MPLNKAAGGRGVKLPRWWNHSMTNHRGVDSKSIRETRKRVNKRWDEIEAATFQTLGALQMKDSELTSVKSLVDAKAVLIPTGGGCTWVAIAGNSNRDQKTKKCILYIPNRLPSSSSAGGCPSPSSESPWREDILFSITSIVPADEHSIPPPGGVFCLSPERAHGFLSSSSSYWWMGRAQVYEQCYGRGARFAQSLVVWFTSSQRF